MLGVMLHDIHLLVLGTLFLTVGIIGYMMQLSVVAFPCLVLAAALLVAQALRMYRPDRSITSEDKGESL